MWESCLLREDGSTGTAPEIQPLLRPAPCTAFPKHCSIRAKTTMLVSVRLVGDILL
jgi:hypothetical protein